MTPAEKLFLVKAYENKVVSDSCLLSAAVANAVGNVLRKKGKKPRALWKKKPRQGDMQERGDMVQRVTQMQRSEGSAWVQAIYRANGMHIRKEEVVQRDRA